MMNKKGFMRILEATIAVLIVSGVLIAMYSKQVDRGIDPVDYFRDLQNQILKEISFSNDLRTNVLRADDENPSDPDFIILKDFVESKIPDFVGYTISLCNLDDDTDFCGMKYEDVIQTNDKNVFVEDIIVSSDLGDGSDPTYMPKKLRLYMWEK